MPSPVFHFKQFSIRQDKCPMKVGTDGVLLGAWAGLLLNKLAQREKTGSGVKKILDVGTGTGLIALMLAQKLCEKPDSGNYIIDAIDTDESSCCQAKENIAASAFKLKINVVNQAYHRFAEDRDIISYDMIISNPPFFNKSLKSPSTSRNIARHADFTSLDSQNLIVSSIKLLSLKGNLCLVLPKTEGENFISEAKGAGLYCTRLTRVFPKPGKECNRLLMEFQRQEKTIEENVITIETGKKLNDFTEEYKMLTKDFYLHF